MPIARVGVLESLKSTGYRMTRGANNDATATSNNDLNCKSNGGTCADEGSRHNNGDGAIPIVVQRALGMQNLTTIGASRCDVISGLEGHLLPRYLSLRAGLCNGRRGNANRSLPGELLRAEEEERQSRLRNKGGARGKGKSRSRKRKRKSDHRGVDPSDESGGDTNNDVPGDEGDVHEGSTQKASLSGEGKDVKGGRRRKRRRRGKTAKDAKGSSDSDDAWVQYQTMARIVVAPYTSSSIKALDRCKQHMEEQEGDEDDEDSSAPATQPDALEAAAGLSTSSNEPSSSVQNVYLKSKSTSSSGGFLVLSPPQESLESMVDGAIDVLVRRTHRFRSNGRRKGAGIAVGKNGERAVPWRRRRRSRDRARAPLKQTSSTQRDAKRDIPTTNNWLLEQNLLSAGYTLGSGDTLSSKGSQRRDRVLRGCPTMAPGVQCVHPNSLASYARSSSLMKLLHTAVGDDVLREMLVNCIVLVPAVSEGTPGSVFERGNYFQLCGPPLNVLARKFDEMGAEMKAGDARSRKRKREGREGDPASVKRPSSDELGSKYGETDSPDIVQNRTEESERRKERWDPNRPIPRGNLFYCDFYARNIGLSPRHLLNQPEDSAKGSSPNSNVNVKLLNSMVHLWPSARDLSSKIGEGVAFSRNKRRGRWRRLREGGVAMCRELRRRHQRCGYGRLLQRHCPLPAEMMTHSSAKDLGVIDAKAALARHVAMHTPAEDVGSFLEAVLGKAFPTAFWGSARNFRRVVQTMRVFTGLGRAEQFPEKAITEGIRVLDMTWLLPRSNEDSARKSESEDERARGRRSAKLSRSDHESATSFVRSVMRWLYLKFIIPLLRSTFYITETEFTGNRVLYYRRPVWERIRSLSMKTLLKQQYREIDAAKAQKVLSIHNVGCPPAPLRLLPKKTGVRSIAMLSKSCQGELIVGGEAARVKEGATNQKATTPSNKILQSTFHALKYEHEKKPSLFGAGVLGLTEVFPSFCLFVEALKTKRSSFSSSATGSHPVPIFFASADIKHCYDTINQKRLFKLLKSVVEEDVYLTKNNFILHTKDRNGALRCQWRKSTFAPDQFSRFLATSNAFSEKYFQSIFVDGVRCSMEKKDAIIGLLRDHIFGQLIVTEGSNGQRYLLQKDGIPQGSILSSMFCNIYFGDVEGFLLTDVFDKDTSAVIRGSSSAQCDVLLAQGQNDLHLLVRIVDDFLLMSTSKETSTRFLTKLNKGVPSLGVKINSDKSRVNYPLELKNYDTGAMEAVTPCQSTLFPWCGLLIDTQTCEISLDYERFSGAQARDAVVVHRAGSEGLHLKKKMKDFVRPRCSQKLLFSSHINGVDVIRLNFYQTCVLCAVKTLHYIENGSGASLKHQQRFVYDSACDTIQFAFLLITSKIKHGKAPSASSLAFQLPWDEAVWLGRHAFFSVFRKGGKCYAELCKMFSESSRASNRKDLLAVSKRALKVCSIIL